MMDDEEAAQRVYEAVNILNTAIYTAHELGLRVEVETIDYNLMSIRYPVPIVNASIVRPIRAK